MKDSWFLQLTLQLVSHGGGPGRGEEASQYHKLAHCFDKSLGSKTIMVKWVYLQLDLWAWLSVLSILFLAGFGHGGHVPTGECTLSHPLSIWRVWPWGACPTEGCNTIRSPRCQSWRLVLEFESITFTIGTARWSQLIALNGTCKHTHITGWG